MKCDNCAYAPKVVTNGERIRSNDRQLAKALVSAAADGCPPEMDWDCMKEEDGWDSCEECWLMYLRMPTGEE